MLDMSYQLRRQSETMQEKLKQEMKKKEDAEEVLCISDDDMHKNEFPLKAEQTANIGQLDLVNDEENTQASGISNSEEFTAIEPDNQDVKSESTVIASETEAINDLDTVFTSTLTGKKYKVQTSRPLSPDDIDSNESYDVAMPKMYATANPPDDEIVDIGEINDEFVQDEQNTLANSEFGSPLEFCSIDLVSNPGSPTHHVQLEESSCSSPYTCVTCNETFSKKKDYQEHIQQHGNERYQCVQCLAYFPTRYRLGRHELTHMDNAATFNCTLCTGSYTSDFNLQRHIRACHSKDEQYHCEICQVSYARLDVLKRHVLTIHTNKKWHCKACGER